MQIIAIRAHTEGLNVEEAALAHLSSIAERASLRYAMQILTPASILAKEAYGRDQILLSDLKVTSPFLFHPWGISTPTNVHVHNRVVMMMMGDGL
jgi:RuvB-like protein 1 (pontin 52)